MVAHPDRYRQAALQKPTWRGVLHSWAAVASVPVGIVLLVAAPNWRAAVAASMFAVAVTVLFSVSAVFHRLFWSDEGWYLMRRLDHSAIFFLIAGSYTPVLALGLDGRTRTLLLAGVWIGTGLGIAVRWTTARPPHGLMTSLFIALGWLAGIAAPAIWRDVGRTETVLIVIEGLLYTAGAIAVGLQRPNPVPGHFGYHEVWHVLVVVAVSLHYVVVFRVLAAI